MIDENKLLYAESHEWANVEGDVCTIGTTRFAAEQLTDIVFVDLPKPGKQIKVGEVFGQIETVKAVSDLYAPLAGEIIDVNSAAANDPAMMTGDPYGKGWLIKIKLSGTPDTSKLMSKGDYDSKASAAH